jgi:hypothetical protein
VDNRNSKKVQLKSLINERLAELERLNIYIYINKRLTDYNDSLVRSRQEQTILIDSFTNK